MNLLAYMQHFFSFLMHEYLDPLWVAGIGMSAILLLFHMLNVKRWM